MFFLIALAVGALAIGGALKAKAAAEKSKAEEAAAREEATQVREQTKWKIEDLRTQQKEFLGQSQAMIGRSGVKLTSGSPLAYTGEMSRRMTEDVRRMRQAGEWSAEALEAEAKVLRETRPYEIWGSLLGTVASGAGMFL